MGKFNLINSAIYELEPSKCERLNYQTLVNMSMSGVETSDTMNMYPTIEVFKSIESFRYAVQSGNTEHFDTNKDVLINKRGEIFVFLKDKNNDKVNN